MGIAAAVCVAILAVVMGFVLKLTIDAGEWRKLEATANLATCTRVVHDAAGNTCHACEDVQVDIPTGTAFGTSDHRAWLAIGLAESQTSKEKIAEQERQGDIVVFQPAMRADTLFSDLQRVYPAAADGSTHIERHPDFHPHGLYLFSPDPESASAQRTLFVVNHRRDQDVVDVFTLSDNLMSGTYVRSLAHPTFINLNDVAISPDGRTMYVSNWMGTDIGSLMGSVESFGQMPWGDVVGCMIPTADAPSDARPDCKVVARDHAMPNGVVVSRDNTEVFLAGSIDKALFVYARESPDTVDLTPKRKYPTAPMCDNLDLDHSTGDVYSACHPKVLTFVRYAKSPTTRKSPTEAIVLRNGADAVETLVIDPTGGVYSAATVSAYVREGNFYVLGAVHEDGILVCDA